LTWLDTSFVEGLLRAALAAPLTEAADPASPAPAPSSPFPNATALTALLQTSQPEQDALMRALGGLASVRDAAAAPSLAPPVKLPLAPPPMAFTGQPDSVPPPSADGRGLLTEPPPVAPPGTDAVGAALHPEARSFSGAEVAAIRADFPILNQTVNGYPLAWLDNAATTQKPNAVIQAVGEFYRRDNSNVHRGAHTLAARATDAYENARRKVQTLLKAKSADEIVFVRGATEAINLVAQTFGRAVLRPGDEVLVTVLEHHANIVPWQMICRETGAILRPIPITDIGEVDIDAYLAMLGPKTRMVGLAHVSNTLGTVLPVREMTAMAHAVGARVLIDGAQGVSHMPVDVCQLGCDFYVFSGHKLFGPTGVGALYGRYELLDAMPPWQGGGNMIERVRFEDTTYMPAPTKFEAGTGILAGAVGLGAAIDYVQALGLDRIAAYEHALVDHAMSRLAQIPKLTLYGKAPNKVSVTAFLIEGLAPEKIGRFLDSRGIAVRVGHHCAQPTMDRFGVSGMVRPSFAFYNTFDEIDRLIDALYELCGAGAL
jgi:cysteine desulfurase/selenocysteine lyase